MLRRRVRITEATLQWAAFVDGGSASNIVSGAHDRFRHVCHLCTRQSHLGTLFQGEFRTADDGAPCIVAGFEKKGPCRAKCGLGPTNSGLNHRLLAQQQRAD